MPTRLLLCLIAGIYFTFPSYGQARTDYGTNAIGRQFGLSCRAVLEFPSSKQHPIPILRFSANAGVGGEFLHDWIYPSVNIEVQLYNGGLGSKSTQRNPFQNFDLDIIIAGTATFGGQNYMRANKQPVLAHRDIPLYYFSNFVYPALQNPYRYSFSLGTNFIITFLNTAKGNQRVGFVNAHVDRVQASYYNDRGLGFAQADLGDKKNRNYTGGAIISYHGAPYTALSLVEVSYHQFSGDVARQGGEQTLLNKRVWGVTLANPWKGYGASFQSYNSIQLPKSHTVTDTSFKVPYPRSFSISGQYYYRYHLIQFQ
ncbi:hypothetical protein [Chitinophaga skermanii]|nr:hypothetical protein [Chitinophaga skermanii]